MSGDPATWKLAADRVRVTLANASRLIEAGAASSSLSWYEAVEMIAQDFDSYAGNHVRTAREGLGA